MQSIPSGLPPLQLSTVAIAKLLIKTTLIVWQSVLIATIIVEEYQSKTIMLLYTYPINRKKMIAAKITLVCGIMLIFYLSSEVFQHIAIYIFSRYISFITYQLDNILIQLVIIVSAILLGLVPLYIGMIRKSTIATIVSSLIIVCITSNSQGSTAGLISVPAVAITFGVIGLIFAALAIKKITTSDLY
ncbi:ABC transporter permease [Clostridium botulinum]|nr:ABC transporter permease [Clostridium botulinum]MCJ8171722.1 ABC transporter permease [Clostridium botulinum]